MNTTTDAFVFGFVKQCHALNIDVGTTVALLESVQTKELYENESFKQGFLKTAVNWRGLLNLTRRMGSKVINASPKSVAIGAGNIAKNNPLKTIAAVGVPAIGLPIASSIYDASQNGDPKAEHEFLGKMTELSNKIGDNEPPKQLTAPDSILRTYNQPISPSTPPRLGTVQYLADLKRQRAILKRRSTSGTPQEQLANDVEIEALDTKIQASGFNQEDYTKAIPEMNEQVKNLQKRFDTHRAIAQGKGSWLQKRYAGGVEGAQDKAKAEGANLEAYNKMIKKFKIVTD